MTDPRAIDMRSEAMPLGGGITVRFSLKAGQLEADWRPRVPHGPSGARLLPAYRRARDEFLRRVHQRTGVNMLVVDL